MSYKDKNGDEVGIQVDDRSLFEYFLSSYPPETSLDIAKRFHEKGLKGLTFEENTEARRLYDRMNSNDLINQSSLPTRRRVLGGLTVMAGFAKILAGTVLTAKSLKELAKKDEMDGFTLIITAAGTYTVANGATDHLDGLYKIFVPDIDSKFLNALMLLDLGLKK